MILRLPCPLALLLTASLLTGCAGDAADMVVTESHAPPEAVDSTDEDAPAPDPAGGTTTEDEASGFYALSTHSLAGEPVALGSYAGRVALVVNVASECGLTPQYEGLQALQADLADRGFTVLAFPSNDFGGQEPGSPAEITEFCSVNYGVTFPLFEKVVTRSGDAQSPIYTTLATMTGQLPSWNFGKYVVSRNGERVRYFAPTTAPDDAGLLAAITEELAVQG